MRAWSDSPWSCLLEFDEKSKANCFPLWQPKANHPFFPFNPNSAHTHTHALRQCQRSSELSANPVTCSSTDHWHVLSGSVLVDFSFFNSTHAVWSIHLLLHFFQVCFTWKWKLCLKATEPDKSSSQEKKIITLSRITGPWVKCPPLSTLRNLWQNFSKYYRGNEFISCVPQVEQNKWRNKRMPLYYTLLTSQAEWKKKNTTKWMCGLKMM